MGAAARVALDHPVRVDGAETRELAMRRPKVRDERDARRQADNDADREIVLFANLCEVPPAVVEELDMADYARLQDAYRDFFTPAPRPPGKP